MSEDKKIYSDASRPATLHNGAVSTDFPTLKDAIMAWHRLRPEQAQKASIRVIGGFFTQRLKYRNFTMVRIRREADPSSAGSVDLLAYRCSNFRRGDSASIRRTADASDLSRDAGNCSAPLGRPSPTPELFSGMIAEYSHCCRVSNTAMKIDFQLRTVGVSLPKQLGDYESLSAPVSTLR
jgi:hypothetical protein